MKASTIAKDLSRTEKTW